MATTRDIDQLCERARRAVRRNELEQAIELYKQVLAVDDGRIEAHEGLGTAYVLSHQNELARDHFQTIVRLDPTLPSALINLGAVYNRLGEYGKAVEILQKAVQKDRNAATGFYNLGIAYRRLDQKGMAISAYREAIRLQPRMAEAHQNLGNVYLDMGNLQQAVAQFRKALEVRPDFERARKGLRQAEAAQQEESRKSSPFGRLVDVAQYRKGGELVREARPMTDEEREQDRAALRTCTLAIRLATRDVIEQLKEELAAHLVEMQSTIARGKRGVAILETRRQFLEVRRKAAHLRRQLRARLLKLKAHEELVSQDDA